MDYDEFSTIMYGDHDDYHTVEDEQIIDQDRWHTYYSMVVKEKSSGKFFKLNWGAGSTESQWTDPSDLDWSIDEVVAKEKTITVYERVK